MKVSQMKNRRKEAIAWFRALSRDEAKRLTNLHISRRVEDPFRDLTGREMEGIFSLSKGKIILK